MRMGLTLLAQATSTSYGMMIGQSSSKESFSSSGARVRGLGCSARIVRTRQLSNCGGNSRNGIPGFLNLIAPLSKVAAFPKGWIEALKHTTGVYLLTCPKTKEQYVGSAYGAEGFWHRWMDYVTTGHGGNVALKSREPSDYQISILEVAGSSLQIEDIVAMETRWKRKLQSGEMGLTRN